MTDALDTDTTPRVAEKAGTSHDLTELPPGTLRVPLRAAGAALAISGLLLAALTPFHPSILGVRDIAAVVRETTMWRAIHLAWVVSSLLNIFGAAGIVAAYRGRLGRPGQAALAVTIVGATATAYVMFLEAVAFPQIARDSPELIGDLFNRDGPMLSSPPVFALTALAAGLLVGFAALGVAAARSGVHVGAGAALAASAAAFAAFEGAFIPVVGLLSTLAFSAVLLWWGWLLWRDGRNAVAAERPA